MIDINIRDIDGRNICKSVKGDKATKSIPIILFSASPVELKNYKDSNADAILQRPFDIKVLIGKINKLLNIN